MKVNRTHLKPTVLNLSVFSKITRRKLIPEKYRNTETYQQILKDFKQMKGNSELKAVYLRDIKESRKNRKKD